MKLTYKNIFALAIIILSSNMALTQENDQNRFNKKLFYSLALNGNITDALKLLSQEASLLDESEMEIKSEFVKRFANEYDESNYLESKDSPVSGLLVIYRDYWRRSFISGRSEDDFLKSGLTDFFTAKGISADSMKGSNFDDDTLDILVKKYIGDKGMFTTGFGMTGKYYDLLVWREEQDTVYEFYLNGRKISPRVVFMSGFVTLGWEEYATLGRYYPGGWAVKDALYCVRDAYDLESENFLVSYLAHEGQHMEDYKLFPKLSGTDLEYRAKLVELSLANETLKKTLYFFISNADFKSGNAHSIANYCVIRDLSREMFDKEFIGDTLFWSNVPADEINNASGRLFERNTEELMRAGGNVVNFIKPD